MGTSVSDMMWIKSSSSFVVGTDPDKGGAGDPSPWTARGVFLAMKAAAERVFPIDGGLKGKRVAIQGVGHVGMYLLEYLAGEGATVTVCDTNEAALRHAADTYGAKVVAPEAIYDVPCDIFSPCAIGQTINPQTVARLTAQAIVGAANNQLSDRSVYADLERRKILYCPDFAVNSGGVICVGAELASGGPNTAWIREKVELIYATTCQVLDQAKARGAFTEEVAVELAKQRIAAARSK
jgi:leucine dehydrogenase